MPLLKKIIENAQEVLINVDKSLGLTELGRERKVWDRLVKYHVPRDMFRKDQEALNTDPKNYQPFFDMRNKVVLHLDENKDLTLSSSPSEVYEQVQASHASKWMSETIGSNTERSIEQMQVTASTLGLPEL